MPVLIFAQHQKSSQAYRSTHVHGHMEELQIIYFAWPYICNTCREASGPETQWLATSYTCIGRGGGKED